MSNILSARRFGPHCNVTVGFVSLIRFSTAARVERKLGRVRKNTSLAHHGYM